MELWVRSQDRIKLIKVDEVKIETVKGGNTFIYSHATDLGTYTTRERALEVLDEIQKIIKWCQNDMKNVTIGDMNNLKGRVKDYVYEMPKE